MITATPSRGKALWARSKARLLRASDGESARSQTLAWVTTRYAAQQKEGATGCRILVAGADINAHPQHKALSLARSLAHEIDRVLLIDTSQGSAALSGPLELPRSPGLSELCQRKAGFDEVVRRDPESPLHFLASGKPRSLVGDWGASGTLDKICRAFDEHYALTIFCAEQAEAMLLARTLRRPFAGGVLLRSRMPAKDAGGRALAENDIEALEFPLLWLDEGD